MLNTPNYNIPYPQSTDAPDGATQMANIAVAVDTAIDGVSDSVVAHRLGANVADLTTSSIHHTIGTGATQAAPGNHNHNTDYAYDLDTGATTSNAADIVITSIVSSSPTVIDTITFNLTQETSVLILGECSLNLDGTLASNYVYVGFRVDSAVINYTQITGGTTPASGYAVSQVSTHTLLTLASGSHTITLCGYREVSAITATATLYRMTVVPIKAIS